MTSINLVVAICIVFFVAADAHSETVAFHASNNNRLMQPVVDQALPLVDVLTNEGGGYNATTCVFTAPSCGVYVFNLQVVMNGFGSLMNAQIVVGDQAVSALEAFNENAFDQSMVHAVVNMVKGQQAKAVCKRLRPNNYVKIIGEQHTIFSGFRIPS